MAPQSLNPRPIRSPSPSLSPGPGCRAARPRGNKLGLFGAEVSICGAPKRRLSQPMTRAREESGPIELKRLAEELARRRKEPPTSAHLLAAVVSCSSAAADLLVERRIDADRLLQAAGSCSEEAGGLVGQALQHARELARRMASATPTASHVLLALLSQRDSAAQRVLVSCGVDLGKLRVAAMNAAELGLVARRRVPGRTWEPPQPVRTSTPHRRPRGVTLSVVPTSRAPARSPRSAPRKTQAKPTTDRPRQAASGARSASSASLAAPRHQSQSAAALSKRKAA